MATFKLTADLEFEAENLSDAAFKVICHLMAVGEINPEAIGVWGEKEFLDLTGEISLRKED